MGTAVDVVNDVVAVMGSDRAAGMVWKMLGVK